MQGHGIRATRESGKGPSVVPAGGREGRADGSWEARHVGAVVDGACDGPIRPRAFPTRADLTCRRKGTCRVVRTWPVAPERNVPSCADLAGCAGKERAELCRRRASSGKKKPELCVTAPDPGKEIRELCVTAPGPGKEIRELCGAEPPAGKSFPELCGADLPTGKVFFELCGICSSAGKKIPDLCEAAWSQVRKILSTTSQDLAQLGLFLSASGALFAQLPDFLSTSGAPFAQLGLFLSTLRQEMRDGSAQLLSGPLRPERVLGLRATHAHQIARAGCQQLLGSDGIIHATRHDDRHIHHGA